MAHEHLGTPSHTVPSFIPAISAPRFYAGDAPTRIIEPRGDIEPRYVLVQSAAPLSPEECEEPNATAIEVTVLWGTSVLHVAHLSPPRAFSIGHGEGAPVDFVVPSELAPWAGAEIVSVRDGAAHVIAPVGAELVAREGTLDIAGDATGGRSAALRAGAVAELRLGALSFRIAAVAAGRRIPRQLGGDVSGLGTSFAATLAAVATFLGALAYYTPALGASLEDDLDPDQIALMAQYLNAHAEPEQKVDPSEGQASSTAGGGTPGQAAKGPEGQMGRPNRPVTKGRTTIAGSGEVQLSRPEQLSLVQNFGMIGMLNSMNSRALPTALWGADAPNGPDATDTWGALFGESIEESGGQGGLGLTGPGHGGGGYGDQIGIGSIGTCGTHCGMGPGGTGIGVGRPGGPGHAPKGPSIRMATDASVSGHIPAEVIQRVVRQNFGRFRQCYESGLRTNPNLTGRVTARFVINRDGSVGNAANGGSDLPDSAVVGCVINAFYGISFPAPSDGVVRVSYPILLTPA